MKHASVRLATARAARVLPMRKKRRRSERESGVGNEEEGKGWTMTLI
jgi:hypothetical protein